MTTLSSHKLLSATVKAPTTTLTVNLQAVKNNWRKLDTRSSTSCKTGAVIKANGYGMGMTEISSALYQTGCRNFFTARIDEALHLLEFFKNKNCDDIDIIVFDGLLEGHDAYFDHPQIIPALNDKGQIQRAQRLAAQKNKAQSCFIHIDTGMSRLGLSGADWHSIKYDQAELQGLDIKMLMSHLASADIHGTAQNREQLSRFKSAVKDTNLKASLANSGGILLGEEYHFDLTRPGLSLYGLTPDGSDQNLEMAFCWQADILQIRNITKGMTVGYGASFVADRGMRLATIGVGYADGYLRRSQTNLSMRIGGIECPVVGRVSMDSCVVDISSLTDQQANKAQKAIIIDDAASAYELADRTDTIIYEIMTILGERVLRHYDDGTVTI